eukprot:8289912-Pyramimonas_sp.AAC.1
MRRPTPRRRRSRRRVNFASQVGSGRVLEHGRWSRAAQEVNQDLPPIIRAASDLANYTGVCPIVHSGCDLVPSQPSRFRSLLIIGERMAR